VRVDRKRALPVALSQIRRAVVLALFTVYPALSWLVSGPSLSRLMTVELWFSFLFASYISALIVFLVEIMPADIRTSGFSLVHSSATALLRSAGVARCSVTHEQAV